MIELDPIYVESYVLVAGDGLVSTPSYQFGQSWVGTLGVMGREVFRAFQGVAGNIAEKNFVIILPYVAGAIHPKRGDELRVYDMRGSPVSRFFVNFVQAYGAGTVGVNQDTTYKIEVHCVRMEG